MAQLITNQCWDSEQASTDRQPAREFYRKLYMSAVKGNSTLRLSNGSPEEAAMALFALIDQANKEVLIYAGSLKSTIWGDEDVKRAIVEALKRDVRFRIVVETMPEGGVNHDLFQCVRINAAAAVAGGKFKVRVNSLNRDKFDDHYTVVDYKRLRREPWSERETFSYMLKRMMGRMVGSSPVKADEVHRLRAEDMYNADFMPFNPKKARLASGYVAGLFNTATQVVPV